MISNNQKISSDILFCLPDFSGGGAEKVMMTLVNAFRKTNTSCCVLSEDGPLRERMPDTCKLINLNCISAFRSLPKLVKLFDELRPKIIFSTLAYFNFIVLIAVLLSRHRPDRIIVREANSPRSTLSALPTRWIGKLCYKILYNRADVVICNANYVRAELIELGVNSQVINVIPNPVDVKKSRKLALEKNKFPKFEEYTLPLFVAAGRLTEQKGMDRLVKWLGRMHTKANLLIMGEGPKYDALIRQIQRNYLSKRIKLIDYQKNPFPLLAKADAILLGSRWEGLPNVALEALALGKTVIATRQCGGLIDMKRTKPVKDLIIAETEEGFVAELEKGLRKISNNKKIASTG